MFNTCILLMKLKLKPEIAWWSTDTIKLKQDNNVCMSFVFLFQKVFSSMGEKYNFVFSLLYLLDKYHKVYVILSGGY